MQEYWVNVYDKGCSDVLHYTQESAVDGALNGFNRNRAIYRIHVKMKPKHTDYADMYKPKQTEWADKLNWMG